MSQGGDLDTLIEVYELCLEKTEPGQVWFFINDLQCLIEPAPFLVREGGSLHLQELDYCASGMNLPNWLMYKE